MMYCNQCGAPLPQPTGHCPACGAPTPYAAAPAQSSAAPGAGQDAAQNESESACGHTSGDEAPFTMPGEEPGPSGPRYRKIPVSHQSGEKLSAVQYMLTFLLFSVPVVGLVAMLLYAFSEKGNPRRELARGFLLFRLILAAIVFALVFVGIFLLWKLFPVEYYTDSRTYMPNPYSGDHYYSEPYDDLLPWDDWEDYFGEDFFENFGSADEGSMPEPPHHSM